MINRTVFQERALGTVVLYMALGLFLFHVPFIVCAFYYKFNNQPCTLLQIQNTAISFTLRTWLQVDAYICIVFIALLLTLSTLSCLSIDKPNYLTAYTITTTIFGTLRIIWLIVGSIMFWGYLQPKNLCSSGFSAYMWANLILGFAGAILYYFLGYTYPRINPLPLKVMVPEQKKTKNNSNQLTQMEIKNGSQRDMSMNVTKRGFNNPYQNGVGIAGLSPRLQTSQSTPMVIQPLRVIVPNYQNLRQVPRIRMNQFNNSNVQYQIGMRISEVPIMPMQNVSYNPQRYPV